MRKTILKVLRGVFCTTPQKSKFLPSFIISSSIIFLTIVGFSITPAISNSEDDREIAEKILCKPGVDAEITGFNLIKNGSFEEFNANGIPTNWTFYNSHEYKSVKSPQSSGKITGNNTKMSPSGRR